MTEEELLNNCQRCGAMQGSFYGNSCHYCSYPVNTPYDGPGGTVDLTTCTWVPTGNNERRKAVAATKRKKRKNG